MERDHIVCNEEYCSKISTHTLTWSVTLVLAVNLFVIGNFNSHAHVERDGYVKILNQIAIISTHTLTWSVTF